MFADPSMQAVPTQNPASAILDALGEPVLAADAQGHCTFANQAARRLFGLRPEADLKGTHLHDLLHGSRSAETPHSREDCQIYAAIRGRTEAFVSRDTIRIDDGKTVDLEYRAFPIERGPGHGGVVVMGTDISGLRRAQEESVFQRVLLDAQSNASIDGILVVGADTKMISFNRRFVDLWGVPRDIVESRSDQAALGWVLQKLQDPEAFIAKVKYLYEHPEESSRDLIKLKDGRFFDRYSAPVQDSIGTHHGRVWFFRDVTDSKRAEAELARLCKEAQEAVRIRDEFMSIASHELKTPLTTILLQTQNVQRRTQRAQDGVIDAEWIEPRANALTRHVVRLNRLVDELLDITRITAGRLSLDPELVDLKALVEEVVGRHSEDSTASGSSIRLHVEGPVTGQWDRLRLDQVLTNLISNAIKYGEGKPIDVFVEKEGKTARLRVRDEGRGIDPADQQRIFERFERAVSTRSHVGFGLGLWIVHQIVSAHGGSIEVTSALGQGSTFSVSLPCEGVPAR